VIRNGSRISIKSRRRSIRRDIRRNIRRSIRGRIIIYTNRRECMKKKSSQGMNKNRRN